MESLLEGEGIHPAPAVAGEGHVSRERLFSIIVEGVPGLDEKVRLQGEHGAVDFVAVVRIVPQFEFLAGGDGEGEGDPCIRRGRCGEAPGVVVAVVVRAKGVASAGGESPDGDLVAEIG